MDYSSSNFILRQTKIKKSKLSFWYNFDAVSQHRFSLRALISSWLRLLKQDIQAGGLPLQIERHSNKFNRKTPGRSPKIWCNNDVNNSADREGLGAANLKSQKRKGMCKLSVSQVIRLVQENIWLSVLLACESDKPSILAFFYHSFNFWWFPADSTLWT